MAKKNRTDGSTSPDASMQGMFSNIAPCYDILNHTLSLGLDLYWRRQLIKALRPQKGEVFLDLAAGTLDVSQGILKKQFDCSVLAGDLALPMLQHGQKKIKGQSSRLLPFCADGRLLPLPSSSVHKVAIAFGIRNIQPRSTAYTEILRILKPCGRLAILEFGSAKNKIWKGMYNLYLQKFLPIIGRIVSQDPQAYSYLAQSIQDFPSAKDVSKELQQAGFCESIHLPLTSGIVNIHLAHKPQR